MFPPTVLGYHFSSLSCPGKRNVQQLLAPRHRVLLYYFIRLTLQCCFVDNMHAPKAVRSRKAIDGVDPCFYSDMY